MEYIIDSKQLNRETNYGCLRMAMECDVPGIIALLTPTVKRIFRIEDPEDKLRKLINCCVLTITHLDTKGKVIGFLALDDYPKVPSVDPSVWEQWVWNCYKAQPMNARNTLFISAFVWSELHGIDLMKDMLTSVFMLDMYLQHLTIYKADPSDNFTNDPKADNIFRRIVASPARGRGDKLACLLVAHRDDVCPPLRVRKAMESDNDELTNIIDAQTCRLKNIYGSFYISELVACHPESNRVILVAEQKDLIVGVMCFDDRVNYVALAQDFDLAPYCDLVKYDEDQTEMSLGNKNHQINEKKEVFGMRTASDLFVESESKMKTYSKDKTSSCPSLQSKQSTTASADESVEMEGRIVIDMLEVLAVGEDFDFEIVNIDSNLLKVPKSVSFASFVYGDRTKSEYDQSNVNKSEYFQKQWQNPDNKDLESQNQPSVNFSVNQAASLDFIANAFVLELFAMEINIDERRGFEILLTAFDVFSKYDYCILMVPTNTKVFPLLEHFTRVSQNDFKQTFRDASLYIAHRNSICANLSVRLAEINDIPAIETLLEKLPKRNEFNVLIKESLTDVNVFGYQTLILLSENQPVGFTTISKLRELVFIRGIFNLDRSAQCRREDGNILACVFTPILHPHSRWYAREILRHTGFRTLIWKSQIMGRAFAAPANNLISLIDTMAPASLRAPPQNKIEMTRSFHWEGDKALWYIDRPMTSLRKLDINANILVIGASLTSYSFIKNLIFGSNSMYLTFPNISLVSPQGLPIAAECIKSASTCIPNRYVSHRNVSILPIFFYVDIVTAKMVNIDRKLKCITLDNGNIRHYDYLILCCGRQFQLPILPARLPKDTPCSLGHLDKPNFKDDPFLHPPDTVPDNLMLINSVIDASNCLSQLIKIMSDAKQQGQRDRMIVIYGNRIEVYTCISSILETKIIRPEDIVFVDPTPLGESSNCESITCFNDDVIDERVNDTMKAIGIKMYSNFEFYDYEVAYNRIHTLKFISNHQLIRFPCLAFFYFGNQQIDYQTYSAITNCGLVWNGGLVIDTNFRTNDPYIYAAGIMTRYSNALHSSKYLHKYYNPSDIGGYLAEVFLNFLDPLRKTKPTNSNLVPTFTTPYTCYAMLPGSWYYLQVTEPGQPIPVLVRRTLGTGHALSTDKDGNSFLIHLNSEHKINGITCLSKKPFSPGFLAMLYGKHEKIFGNLITRYLLCNIDDFFDYFNKPWISALVHGAFEELIETTRPVEDFVVNCTGPKPVISEFASVQAISKMIDEINLYVRYFKPILPHYAMPLHPKEKKNIVEFIPTRSIRN